MRECAQLGFQSPFYQDSGKCFSNMEELLQANVWHLSMNPSVKDIERLPNYIKFPIEKALCEDKRPR